MSAPKLVLVVLILIAVLFAVGVGLGVGRDNKGVDLENDSWIQALDNLIEKERLKPGEVRADRCLQGGIFILQPSTTCQAEIVKSETRVRTTTLKLIEGRSVHVEFLPHDEEGVAVRMTLEKDKPCKLQVFRKGGKLTLAWKASDSPPPHLCKVEMGQ